MRLVKLRTHAFRNLADAELDTDARFVVVHGPNAQGKTNLLEAVWVLATLRPLRGPRTRELLRFGEADATVSGRVVSPDGWRELRVDLGGPRRRALVDGAPVRDLAEYFAWVRAIAFTPSDAAIVTEGPDVRRAWLDRAAFTAHPAHLHRVRAHERILQQKAALLREPRVDRALLDVLDAQLAGAGAALVTARVGLLRELAPHVRALHADIAGQGAEVGIRYRTDAEGETPEARAAALTERLRGARDDELRRGRPLVGAQRDEIRLSIDGHATRTYGSRGQVRSLVLAMKLAELVAAHARGEAPLFLLDDLSSELDRARTARLVERLSALKAQVWVTTTDPDHLGALPPGDALRLAVRDGVATPDTAP